MMMMIAGLFVFFWGRDGGNDGGNGGSFSLLRANAMKFMTTYHNETIMVARNAREIHANAEEETIVSGDTHSHNEEQRGEVKGTAEVREGGRIIVNGEDLEEEIDVISDEMASLRALAADLKVTLTPPPAPPAPPPNSPTGTLSPPPTAQVPFPPPPTSVLLAPHPPPGVPVASVNALTDATLKAAISACLSEINCRAESCTGECANYGSSSGYGTMPNWDTSQITDMSAYPLFGNSYQQYFNADISNWDVSQVTKMYRMFENAKAFNQNIGGWDVSAVTDMERMFRTAKVFDQEIGRWDVSQVTNMRYMFQDASKFSGSITRWNDTKASNRYRIFYQATAFRDKFACENQDDGPVRSCECKSELYCLTDATYHDAVRNCLAEDPVAGLCDIFGSKTMRFGVMPRWNTRWVTNMNGENETTSTLICLLYTSPSPRDLSTSRMPSSA